jgi:predicted nucleic acid-binding protein
LSYYLDSSAILKIIFQEDESAALAKFITEPAITSSISRVEVLRTVQRIDHSRVQLAQSELAKINIVEPIPSILTIAENFSHEVTLRSLDAIHVATLIFLSAATDGLITYDKLMAKNAEQLGLIVLAPGSKN